MQYYTYSYFYSRTPCLAALSRLSPPIFRRLALRAATTAAPFTASERCRDTALPCRRAARSLSSRHAAEGDDDVSRELHRCLRHAHLSHFSPCSSLASPHAERDDDVAQRRRCGRPSGCRRFSDSALAYSKADGIDGGHDWAGGRWASQFSPGVGPHLRRCGARR